MSRMYLILPIIIFVVSCFDLGATLYFSRVYVDFEEANPIAEYFWKNHGDIGLCVFKLSVTLLSCLCMGWVLRNKNRAWKIAVSIFGFSGCVLLIGWWIFWIFHGTIP